jgi:hypothetical protein
MLFAEWMGMRITKEGRSVAEHGDIIEVLGLAADKTRYVCRCERGSYQYFWADEKQLQFCSPVGLDNFEKKKEL